MPPSSPHATSLGPLPLRAVLAASPGGRLAIGTDRIEIRDRVHDGRLMEEYRIDGEVIEEMPVNCVITRPASGFKTRAGQPVEAVDHRQG